MREEQADNQRRREMEACRRGLANNAVHSHVKGLYLTLKTQETKVSNTIDDVARINGPVNNCSYVKG